MKTLFTLLAFLATLAISAQKNQTLIGKVMDQSTHEPVPFANITLLDGSNKLGGATTDFDGLFEITNLQDELVDIQVDYVGYQTKRIEGIDLMKFKNDTFEIFLNAGVVLESVEIIAYKRPLFEMDKTTVSETKTREDVERLAVRSASDIAKTAGNGRQTINMRGGRASNSVTFVDGIQVFGVHEEVHIEDRDRYPGENYQELVDNVFKNPLDNPLSTFSIDVDKAAYANVRRYLNQGSLPPVDAVRIEEMINYFDYEYEQPTGDDPFAIHTEFTACPWNSERQLAMIGIQGKDIDMTEAPASNLVFLIDVSGSMGNYDKLPLLKQGLELLIENLRPEDRIAIVVYAGAAGLALESTSGEDKRKIKQVLNHLSAGGSTAGGAGIQLAYKVARENFIEEGNNRIILATDGDFNVGTSSQKDLEKMIEKERESGVFLSVLGFGQGNLQDYKMEQIADHGNGNYSYIDNILEAKKVLVNEMGGTLFTIAKDVKVQAEFNPAKVKAYRLIGYINRALADEDFNDDRKDAGELGAGHTVTALYEIIPINSAEKIMDVDELKYQKQVKPETANSNEILTVKFRYKKPDGDTSILITKVLEDKPVALSSASEHLRFSTAVASFGMKLRGSESVDKLNYEAIIKQAKEAKGEDDEGYRAEFVRLVEMAMLLDK